MDTLALLCNLHADGPATLQRLRRAGCESLAALRRMDPVRLAERLEWNERAAERFLREAALLSGRVEPEEEDTEDASVEFELESELVADLDGDTDEAESEEEEDDSVAELEDEEPLAVAGPAPERVEVVLGAWRELDRVAPPSDPVPYEIPRPEPLPDVSLSELGWNELSEAQRARLQELGIASLRSLAEADPLRLSRGLGLGFTRTTHLCFRARRELERLPPAAAPQATPSFEPFSPPPSEPFETAGPFA